MLASPWCTHLLDHTSIGRSWPHRVCTPSQYCEVEVIRGDGELYPSSCAKLFDFPRLHAARHFWCFLRSAAQIQSLSRCPGSFQWEQTVWPSASICGEPFLRQERYVLTAEPQFSMLNAPMTTVSVMKEYTTLWPRLGDKRPGVSLRECRTRSGTRHVFRVTSSGYKPPGGHPLYENKDAI
ncbi:hypothetical protein BD413DRAFT_220749 [Trametes elegans]|nr:hypothetical protein BD413DRAFT_220749 [Trametes elegans]